MRSAALALLGATLFSCARAAEPSGERDAGHHDSVLSALESVSPFQEALRASRPVERGERIELARSGHGSFALARTSTGAARIDLGSEGAWLTLRATDLRDVPARLDKGAVVFEGARPDTDVVWIGSGARAEELRVVRAATAPDARWEIEIGPSIATVRSRHGRVEVVDREGRVALTSESAFAVDAKGARRDVELTVAARDATRFAVTAHVSFDGLSLPVVVDPAWNLSAPLIVNRKRHQAVRLPSGKVVIFGGVDGTNAASSSHEIFNPATNSFDFAVSSVVGVGIAVAQLPSGKVFRAGGGDKFGDPIKGAAMFDESPAPVGTWTALAPMLQYREDGAAAVISGGAEILVAGGALYADKTAEYYTIASNTWTATPLMANSRIGNTATTLGDGTVLVTGGGTATAERFNRGSNTWTSAGTMKIARTGHTATLLKSGKVLVVGGSSGAELFDPATGWGTTGTPLHARTNHTATLLPDGRVLLSGGGSGIAELYDPSTGTFSAAGNMVSARSQHTATLLTDGRVFVTGGAVGTTVSGTTETWAQLAGASCSTALECVSGFCVDGTCCSVSSCPSGYSCGVAGAKGTCAKPLGAACSAASECGSGFCADGVCCATACTGQCAACNQAGKAGYCLPVLGDPASGHTACSGTGAGTSCGMRCNGADPTRCYFPSGPVACGADACTGGTETRAGTCNGAGSCTTTTRACGVYACGARTCLTSCTTASDCASGYYCKSGACVAVEGLGKSCDSASSCASGSCVDGVCCGDASCPDGGSCALPGSVGKCAKKAGRSCAAASECASGFCVDGVCCNRACDGQCEACDLEGLEGVCSPVSGDPHGTRPKCADGGGDACQAKACNGAVDTKSCTAFAAGAKVVCKVAACDAGQFTAASTCNGAGTCITPASTSCSPYGCSETGCKTTCTTTDDCAAAFSCRANRCEPKTAECSSDELSSESVDGTKKDCSPYRCAPKTGECGSSCATSSDCAPMFVCDSTNRTCAAAPAPEEGDAGGCSMGGRGSSPAGVLLLLIAGVALTRRRLAFAIGALGVGACTPQKESTESGEVVHLAQVAEFSHRISSARPFAQTTTGFASTAGPIVANAGTSACAPVHLAVHGREGVWIEVVPEDCTESPFRLAGAVLAAHDVARDTDVVHLVDPSGFEEVRTLRSSRAPSRYTFRVAAGPGIHELRLRDGRIEAVDAKGYVQLASAPMFAVDARGTRRTPLLSGDDGHRFSVALDTTGLVFPVDIDPMWTVVPSMAVAHVNHAATVLGDGRVLVVGGWSSGATSSELYDPRTNTWSSPATVNLGTCGDETLPCASAVALPSGRALALYSTPSRYNPATNTWSAAGTMPVAVSYSRMVPLSGTKVLAISSPPAAIYDEATNAWTAAASLATARDGFTATRLASGKILVVGGTDGEVYDPVANRWTPTGPLLTPRTRHTATLLASGKVLIAGGGYTVVGISAAELYDPATNAFTAVSASAHTHAAGAASLVISGRALVTGGVAGSTIYLGTPFADLFDPITSTWTSLPNMSALRYHHESVSLQDGRVFVVGGRYRPSGDADYSLATAEIYGDLPGAACKNNLDCASGYCTDGVCCSAASCGTGARCDTPEKPGTCSKLLGVVCGGAGECASGRCVDGVCCNAACSGQCEACDLPGKVGVCSAATGQPHGGRTACTTTPTECGLRCDGSDRTKCNLPGSSVPCGAASCALGTETHVASCNGSGACADTPKTCGSYRCGASSCLTTCSTNVDCLPGNYCKGGACVPVEGLGASCTSTLGCTKGLFCTDGVCCGEPSCEAGSSCALPGKLGTCSKRLAAACSADGECGSGHCVDGVCCDAVCTGQCEACDVTGKRGTCAAIAGTPHGTRAPCADGGGDTCAARTCDGTKDRTTCAGFAADATVTCAPATCAGTVFSGESRCGAGSCTAPVSVECAPYRCDAAGCLTACSKPEHCVDGFTCRDGKCAPIVATCADDRLSSTAKDGTVTRCVPYRCTTTGECATRCATSADCAPEHTCDVGSGVCVAPNATTDDSSGCATSAGSRHGSAWLSLLGLTPLLVRRRGRRRGAA